MTQVVLSVFAILVSQAFITFDEETLIILCSFLWLDAAGGLFKKLLEAELVFKVDQVRAKFVWFLALKKQLLTDLIRFHKKRAGLKSLVALLNNVYTHSLVLHSVVSYLQSARLRRKFETRARIIAMGSFVHYDRLVRNLKKSLVIIPFSGTLVTTRSKKKNSTFSRYGAIIRYFV
jgi:hypothetical protein